MFTRSRFRDAPPHASCGEAKRPLFESLVVALVLTVVVALYLAWRL